jgi:SpoVK/Ycf46/Vps4 family AAA+-type ATPase
MVDCLAYRKMVPTAFNEVIAEPHPSQRLVTIPEAELHFCAPTVLGYSFACKRWGRFQTENFAEIVWSTRAFDHLVLSEEKKALIQSLVFADSAGMITDVIARKAGGSTILLHGKPGTGKTLTAEAAAEMGRKPLMVVSAAELGDTAPQLEAYLQNVLDVCKTWRAILLIDEAELFLEARSLGNINRNAVVSVFLRLLEYHQEVIFLTTNYVTRLDAAFMSRISVAIKYVDLDKTAREEIWERFLTMARAEIIEDGSVRLGLGHAVVTKMELRKLAARNLNGR